MKTRLAVMSLVAVMAAGLSAKAQENPVSLKQIRMEMDAFQKGQVEAFRNVLQKDPEFASEYKVYLSELKSLQNIKDGEQRFAMAVKVDNKHKGLFDRAMKKSKADPEAIRKNAKKMEKKYSFQYKQYHILPGDFMTYKVWIETANNLDQPPQETEVTFTAPFSFEHSSRAGNGRIEVDLESGTFQANADAAIANSFKNKAGLGDYIRVPWATQDIRVSATLPETYVYLAAYAGPGGAGAAASSIIDVLTEDDQRCIKSQEHGSVTAPVVWHSSLEMTDTTILACEMRAPPANQDITVRFQSVADATAGGLASGYATVESTPDTIRVRLVE